MRECSIAENKKKCNCTYEACDKKGICCECITYHWRLGELPVGFFLDDIERTYDRSIKRFIKTFKERGKWW